MILLNLEVQKLFGLLDYTIPLDKSDITILTGPNGYGKTMLLNIIKSILSNDLSLFHKLTFNSITLKTSVAKIEIVKRTKKSFELTVDVDLIGPQKESFHYKEKSSPISKETKWLNLIEFIDDDKKISVKSKEGKDNIIHSKLIENIFSSSDVTYIQAQRLEKREKNEAIIDVYAETLKELIEQAADTSAQISQKLDSTFPSRLFDTIIESSNSHHENINDRLYGIQQKRKKLMDYGLIHSENELLPVNNTNYSKNKEYLNVLKLYIDDGLEKLFPFEELSEKIDLFSQLLEEKILAFKKVNFSKEQGFYFISDTGENIDRSMLSSGEQNQIVMFFDLIFNSNEKNTILIDEPEISLHIAWQKDFLSSLKRIQKINKSSKIIIATHSPTIIDNKWELTYDLFDAIQGSKK